MSSGSKFSSKVSAVLVAAGCSVGLGNIWRFPYIAGEMGGAAFVMIYLACIVLVGHPVMMSELTLGRLARKSAVGAYSKLGGRKWSLLGFNGVLTAFLIMGFYYVVAGWTADYFAISITGELSKLSTPEEYSNLFKDFVSHPWRPMIFTWVFVAATHLIIYMGVEKGLERASKVLMPLLFVILVGLAINSLMLPNSMEGVKFFLAPDFSKITPSVFLSAVGQAFFSLSIGLGALVAYGAYVPDEVDMSKMTNQIMMLDTSVAIIAGLIIFPAAASVGIATNSGPALVFETLPAIFNMLPMSAVWASVFFLLLILAALTSTMSLHEVITVFFMEEFKMTRKRGALITSISVGLLGSAASLSMGEWSGFTIFGLSLFDFLDFLTSNIMLPLGGMLTCIFVGWRLERKIFVNQLTNNGTVVNNHISLLYLLLKYFCPAVIFAIFLDNIGII